MNDHFHKSSVNGSLRYERRENLSDELKNTKKKKYVS